MALTVGELTGFITIDGTQVRPALRRVEGHLQSSGTRMTRDSEEAGQAAGQALGEGLVRAADGSIRDSRGRFVAAGRRVGQAAGDALGDGLRRGADDGADGAVQAAEGGFSRIKMAAAAAGVAAGAVLMQGIAQYLEQSQITGRLGAQLGATPAVAQKYGRIAGKMYADAVTADFQSAADAISVTMRAGLLPTGATDAQIQGISTKVSDLASTFELDLGQSANAVGQIMKTGLAPNAKTALDVISKGMTQMGPRADDIMDTFNEYSVIFQRLGFDAQTATGLMSQGLKAGARDTDVIADAFKEFTIEGVAGSEKIVNGLKAIGLNSGDMIKMISAGGPQATKALQMTLDKLRGMDDEVKRDAASAELFGTKSEDMQKALLALDPSKAVGALGTFKGASDKVGDSLRDNAGVRLEQFKRGMQQGVVNLIGGRVVPALMTLGQWMQRNSGKLKVVAAVVAGVLVPALILMGITATVRAGQVVAGWVMSGVASLRSAGTQIASAGRVVGAWLLMGGRALLSAGQVVAGWLMTGVSAAGAATAQVAAGARVVGAWLLMGVQALLQGARMAAAWVLAMGPIGWVIAALVALGVFIWKNWDKIKKWTSQAWDWIWGKLKSVGSAILQFFIKWSIVGIFLRHWDSIKTGVATKGAQLVNWMRGLPGRMVSALGALGSLLLEKGRNVVQGLWSGIQGMTGWIKSKLIGWAKSAIPGPIAKALGIHSPSRVTKEQGRWIALGLIDGLLGSAKQIKAAAARAAQMVTEGLQPGKKRSTALGKISAGSKKLLALANREAKVATQLKAAQKRLTSQIEARDKLAADVRKGVLDSGNITSMDGPATADTIINTLSSRVAQAQLFAKQLDALRKKGVRSDLIAQIASAGVEQGAASAAVLAGASKQQIGQINSQQAALVKAAGSAGKTAGDAMYGAGIQAAQGLIRGLQKEQKSIEKQMLTIAKGMQKAIRQALGIKSPSRVMAALGRYIPQGLVKGIDGERAAVDRSMAALVDPSAVPAPTGSAAGSYGAAGGAVAPGHVVIEIKSTGARRDDLLLEELRHAIRVRGGDVQLVLAGKK
ncbi:Gp43 [Streptomyces microflavus DSM 40593]|uniref:Gp43 n=1 Tax=Streptomyces microflavus DSM 40593 TaxID=1303692 RepID=N0CW91_STRMI|nr:phage tail tape measure protein [Streptomyces microflavus]AGK80396.1 Gp43 [Streptomyces microflavus DSM 40593]